MPVLLSRLLLPTVMRIELNRHAGCHRDGLMDSAAMRHFEESLVVIGRDAMRQVNCQCHLAYPMRLFRHGPFRLDAQSLGRDLMAVTVAAHEITDTTGERTDEEFDRTHAGILPSIIDRLIGHDPVLAARDVMPSSAMVGHREFHAPSSMSFVNCERNEQNMRPSSFEF
jgi:hypothetical protein